MHSHSAGARLEDASLFQCALVVPPNRRNQRREFSRSQSLPADENNGRTIGRRQREDLREVPIQRDNHARFAGGVVENLAVRRQNALRFRGRVRRPSLRFAESPLRSPAALGQERRASCSIDLKIDCAIDGGCGECKHLLKIFFLEIRIILEQLQPVRIRREDFQHAPDRDPHPADTGLSAHLAGLDCDPVKWRLEINTTIMTHQPCLERRQPISEAGGVILR